MKLLKNLVTGLLYLLLAIVLIALSPILLAILLSRTMQPGPELRQHEERLRAEQDRMARRTPEPLVDRPPEFLRTGC